VHATEFRRGARAFATEDATAVASVVATGATKRGPWTRGAAVADGEVSAPPPSSTLPNLRPIVPAADIRTLGPDEVFTGRKHFLRFTVDSLNAGDYPLEILSTPEDLSKNRAFQCIVWLARACTGRRQVGEVTFHEPHRHWHFNDFARYELRRVADGRVVTGPGGLIASAGKVSFCLEDSSGPNATSEEIANNAVMIAPLYAACDPLLQGISARWIDEYTWDLPGQSLELDGAMDGTYALVIIMNPTRRLLETNYDDNTATQLVKIGTDAAGDRTVEVINPPKG
jgi:hypothetical protein